MTTPTTRARPVDDSDDDVRRADLDFITESYRAELPPGRTIDRSVIEEKARDPNAVLRLDRDAATCCLIDVNLREQETGVALLLPRTEFTAPGNFAAILEMLDETLLAAEAEHPEALDWPIRAVFHDGRNALGNPDGGRALCELYQVQFPSLVIGRRGAKSEIRSTLRQVAATARTRRGVR